jgi:hypothetical protein
MRVPDLQEKMKDTKFVVYVNACRGSEEEPLKMVEYDSLPHEPANRMQSTPGLYLRNPITSDDATNVIDRANGFHPGFSISEIKEENFFQSIEIWKFSPNKSKKLLSRKNMRMFL